MPRPASHVKMTAQEKYVIFKNAYNSLNSYISKKEFLAAHALAFSILEDRVLATRIQCGEIIEGPLSSTIVKNKIPFEKSTRKLLELKIITKDMHDELTKHAHERNEFLHQAMWRLDEFNHSSIISIRKSINAIEKFRRAFIRANQSK
jgi:hypothetical protein